MVFHFATAAFDGWTEFEKMCGGNWRPNFGHHSARHDYTVTIRDPEHPITRGMKLTFPQGYGCAKPVCWPIAVYNRSELKVNERTRV